MIQSGGIFSPADLLGTLTQVMFQTGVEALKRGVKTVVTAKNAAPELVEKTTEYYINKGINELNKHLFQVKVEE